ncbi:MAG: hypothetical protein GXO49_02400, partial [Chlorobi bacterium]|nr:hypothetical protein [Chlorobiota bacterium]
YKTFFNIIADELNAVKPHIETSDFMLNSLKIFDKIRYTITRKEPRVTKFTIKSSQQTKKYSNNKIKEVLNYNFIPVKESVRNICNRFLLELNSKN